MQAPPLTLVPAFSLEEMAAIFDDILDDSIALTDADLLLDDL